MKAEEPAVEQVASPMIVPPSAAASEETAEPVHAGASRAIVPVEAAPMEESTPAAPESAGAMDMSGDGGDVPAGATERKVQEKTSRCWTCNKKIGLTGFKCRCGYFYCGTHRYEDAHECDFNCAGDKQGRLEGSLTTIANDKVTKF
jgi:hypothetical protein